MKIKHIPHFNTRINADFFGFDENRNESFIYKISNKNGMTLCATDYGATVTSLQIPNLDGNFTDVVLGFDTLKDYIDSFRLPSAPYFGATVGRYAGRIGNAEFVLNGQKINLNKNNGNNALHGGHVGFSQKIWHCTPHKNRLTFTYTSTDGEENYPGTLHVTLTYSLTDDNQFMVEYSASADDDTAINLTHHSYFNLDGHTESVVEQQLQVHSDQYLETDSGNVPTGNFLSVGNTDFDFRTAKNCPQSIDNTFAIDGKSMAATLFSKKNGLKMEVYTNQPGLHIYVGGNCFSQINGKEHAAYHPLSGICFETQNYPDAPNHIKFPNAILKKGEIYHHKTVYHFKKHTT
ncbi:aldose epimerase family protein [Flavobacterium pallidum]|uniref:Aldose 1-epimerase n=1 Tax=Flavobacterium pallidum TaxID=2172098 RepID=A0A2S1SG14_9FLAO|nr:aldose epimerase family protein [Flavobacterium pallidum]AWI25340.1 galactose-1-epimerase [Flavobacterium pallidum]